MKRTSKCVLAASAVFVAVSLSATGCFFSPYSVGSPDSLASQFILAWNLADTYYSSFVTRPDLDWDAVYSQYRPLADGLADQSDLGELLLEMLATAGDGQIMIFEGGQLLRPHDPGYFVNFDPGVWQGYMDEWGFETGSSGPYGWAFATPDSSIGYIYLPGLEPNLHWTDFLAMTISVRDCRGIILDLRINGGAGDYMNAYHIAGRFVTSTEPAFYRQTRKGPGRYDMNDPLVVTTAKQGSWQFSVPVAVLTGRGTDGAGEILTLLLSTQEHVTLFGDITLGAPDVAIPRVLSPDLRTLYLPGMVIYDLDMNPVAGVGVPPHVPVQVDQSHFNAGIDPVLEEALAYLLSM